MSDMFFEGFFYHMHTLQTHMIKLCIYTDRDVSVRVFVRGQADWYVGMRI